MAARGGPAPSSFSSRLKLDARKTAVVVRCPLRAWTRPARTSRISLFLHPPKLGMVTRLLLTCFVLLLFPYSSFTNFSGKVVSVLDGDTIEVLHNNHPERIRLNGTDCPEKGEAFGTRAKQATLELSFGKEVAIQTHGKDKYGRTMADVLLGDGTNVSHTLVKEGWCWWYRKYALGDTILEELETRARTAGIGLWADPHPVPSWEWRHRR